jgi:hypothetical protein
VLDQKLFLLGGLCIETKLFFAVPPTALKYLTMAHLLATAPEPATELGRYRILSSNAGIRVSPLQLGAMSIGNAWKDTMGSMSKEESFKLLDAFYEAGGNFIDTANNY